jgi:hypothetical protein
LAFEQAKRSDEEYLAALKNFNEGDDEPPYDFITSITTVSYSHRWRGYIPAAH